MPANDVRYALEALAKVRNTGKEEQSSKRQFGDDSRPTYSTVARKGIEPHKRQFVDLFKSNLLGTV